MSLAVTGCFTARVGVGPTLTTEGDLGAELKVGAAMGIGSSSGGLFVGATLGGGRGENGATPTMAETIEVSGLRVRDPVNEREQSLRLGILASGRTRWRDSGVESYYGGGGTGALYHVIEMGSSTRSGKLIGAELQLDYVRGAGRGFGTAWLPVVYEALWTR
jgi:hypothetical protein